MEPSKKNKLSNVASAMFLVVNKSYLQMDKQLILSIEPTDYSSLVCFC